MKKRNRKKWNIVSLLMAAIFVMGGVYAVLTAPAERMTADQQQLQSELEENKLLLNQSPSTTPSSTEEVEAIMPTLKPEPEAVATEASVTAIGDSVMLGAAPELQTAISGCIVDAEESRQIWDAIETVQELESRGQLGDVVIIGLGSNGSFDQSTGQELLDAIGVHRNVYWIAVYGKFLGWQDDVNRMVERLAEENENLTVIDWPETAEVHKEWFYDDGMHLNEDGQAGYADLIARSVSEN